MSAQRQPAASSPFRPFCSVCGTERRTGSSNRNFEFDYCINCKQTTSFTAERTVPTALIATELADIDSLSTLRFDINSAHESLFDADEELTSLCRNGVGGGASVVPVLSDQRLHSGNFVVDFVVSGAEKGAGMDIGFGIVWNVGVQLASNGRLGGTPTTWAFDPSTGSTRTNDQTIATSDEMRLADGRGIVRLVLRLPRAGQRGQATFSVRHVGQHESEAVHGGVIELPESAVVVVAASFTAKGQRIAISCERQETEIEGEGDK